MIIAIWGGFATGKSTIADALGSLYAKHGTAGVVDSCLCWPTLPMRLPGMRLDTEHSLGRYLNRLGSNEIRPYFHQSPHCEGLFHAGLTDGDKYTDFEIGFEAVDRAREFLLESEKLLDVIILDCSSQRTDPFLPVMLRDADVIVIPIVPNGGAVHWFGSVQSMLKDAGVMDKILPVANAVLPFHLTDEVEKQIGIPFAARFPMGMDIAQACDECRLATEANRREGIHWETNLRKLYQEIERRMTDAAFESESEVVDG